jgi:hypothetical protein
MTDWEAEKKQFWENIKLIDELKPGHPRRIELIMENNKILGNEVVNELWEMVIQKNNENKELFYIFKRITMKKLKPGYKITEEGYFYTLEENEKNLRRLEALKDIKKLVTPNKNISREE